jgi:hypothetical protein
VTSAKGALQLAMSGDLLNSVERAGLCSLCIKELLLQVSLA